VYGGSDVDLTVTLVAFFDLRSCATNNPRLSAAAVVFLHYLTPNSAQLPATSCDKQESARLDLTLMLTLMKIGLQIDSMLHIQRKRTSVYGRLALIGENCVRFLIVYHRRLPIEQVYRISNSCRRNTRC